MSYRGEQKTKGKIYVYEATAVWNAEKKRSEQKRIYIGTKDPETGIFYPNKNYARLYGDGQGKDNTVMAVSFSVMHSVDFGNVCLMKHAVKMTGLDCVLQDCFPDSWQEILSCAWHSCSENEALYLCEQWAENSYVPAVPSSQRISELLKELDEDHRMLFYKKWAALRCEREYLALDITSVSSWSELIEYVEHGYNRDHEKLPQINIAMLFGEQSRLPVFCRIYPGSIKDVSTLAGLVTFIEQLKLKQMHFVMDKGFYHADALHLLLEKHIKFAVGVPFTTNLAKDAVMECRGHINTPQNAIEVDGHLYYTETLRSTMKGRRVYTHVYYDEQRYVLERTALMKKILKLEAGLADGSVKQNESQAQKYFSFHKTKEGINIRRKQEVINEESQLSGYFVILTNDSKDAKYILDIYRTKDAVEKSFDNIKNDLDLERLRIHSDAAMEGRVFIGFISLIIMSYIRKVMKDNDMYKSYSFNTLLGELKKQKLVVFSNGQKLLTELTRRQKAIYKAFGIPLPDVASI